MTKIKRSIIYLAKNKIYICLKVFTFRKKEEKEKRLEKHLKREKEK